MAKDPGHRTSPRTLRRLASGHVFYEFGDQPPGLWDNFSTRNIGLAVQRQMAQEFNSDSEAMARAAAARLFQVLELDQRQWNVLEQSAFSDFALVLWLAPEISGWDQLEKRKLAEVIRAKVSESESQYLHLLQEHHALREVFLRLGSDVEASED